jgi:hypothetical protein
MSQFHKAERKRGKLRLAIAGPAGSGKTYSALLIAFGIGGKVAFIDTERGSGELYDHLGEYDACTLEAPFEPKKYVAAIKAAEETGYNTIIIDSLIHAWAGTGGLLDRHGMIADKSGNSWAAWRMVTPQQDGIHAGGRRRQKERQEAGHVAHSARWHGIRVCDLLSRISNCFL